MDKWYRGELQFLIEQPTLTVEGVPLSLVNTVRVTIDRSGRITGIDIGDEWCLTKAILSRETHPKLWDAVVVYCETADDEPITACLLEYQCDRPNRIADHRNAWREAI